jgi:hypothetical protein
MPKKKVAAQDGKKEILVKTDLSFDEFLKKALTTPLPESEKKKKAKKK